MAIETTPKLDETIPKEVKNPYREASKKYLVAQRTLAGDIDTKAICRDIGVNQHTVYNVRGDLRKLGFIAKEPGDTPPATIPAKTTPQNPPPAGSLGSTPSDTPLKPDTSGDSFGEKKPIPSESPDAGDIMERTAQRVMQLMKDMNRQPPSVADDEREVLRVVSTKDPATTDEGYARARDDFERIVMVEASPILKKVALNPKVYLWYDYAKSEKGYKGDIGDFVIDAVEDFWRSRGYRIIVTQEKEVLA